MVYGFWCSSPLVLAAREPTIGHPRRDRAKIKAGRKAARRNKR